MGINKIMESIYEDLKRISKEQPILIAIDGVDTSGKTTFSKKLSEYLVKYGHKVINASIDGFHNPRNIRYKRGAQSSEGYYRDSFNYDSLIKNLLEPLSSGSNLPYRTSIFDFKTESKIQEDFKYATKDSILIMEGVFLLRPEISGFWDYSIFLHVDFDQVILRAKERDGYLFGSEDEITRRYIHKYIPGQQLYIREANPYEKANLIIDNSNYLEPKIISLRDRIIELSNIVKDFKG